MTNAQQSQEQQSLLGRWRIVPMSAWDEGFVDEEEEGYIEVDAKDIGAFRFGYGQLNDTLLAALFTRSPK